MMAFVGANQICRRIINLSVPIAFFWDVFQSIFGTNKFKKRVLSEYITPPGRILEIGCATGNIADVFNSFDYTGIDTDCSYIERAKKKFPLPHYKFYCVDVLSGFLPAGHYDYVLLSHTAHHLPVDYFDKVISMSHSLLKTGGYLVIFDMIKPSPTDLLGKRFYYRLDRGNYIRNIDEFMSLFNKNSLFKKPVVNIIETRKLSVRIIDQCLIMVQK